MFILVFGISIVSALGWHSLCKGFWLSSIGSAITTMLLTWLIASSHIGYFDLQFIKNMSLIGLVSFGLSVVVGSIIKKITEKGDSSSGKNHG